MCNLGAGAAVVKAHLAEAGAIPALLDQLAPTADAGLAQLAALSLRNLSKHPLCKIQVINSGGVSILLDFLSEGLEVLKYPLRCEVCSIYCFSSSCIVQAAVIPHGRLADVFFCVLHTFPDSCKSHSATLYKFEQLHAADYLQVCQGPLSHGTRPHGGRCR